MLGRQKWWLVAAVPVVLLGCSKSPPKCSDEETLSLVRKLLLEQVGEPSLSDADAKSQLVLDFARASSYDEKIKKLTCEAKLVAGGSYQVPVSYESQLDDKDQQIVSLSRLAPGDLMGIKAGLSSNNQQETSTQSIATQDVSTLGEATPPAPSETDPLVGKWKGSLEGNGDMDITKDAQGYHMDLGVSSPEGCTGSIDGVGTLVGNVLTVTKSEDDQTCKITATFQGKTAALDEDGCSAFHGAACSFIGTLKKTR